jgi:hypothetical protein
MLPFLVPVLFTFYIQVCYNLNVKHRCQKVKERMQTDYVGSGNYLGGWGENRGSMWVDSVAILGIVRKWHF